MHRLSVASFIAVRRIYTSTFKCIIVLLLKASTGKSAFWQIYTTSTPPHGTLNRFTALLVVTSLLA